MATRAEREKSKKKLEQAHAILTHLLREDDNKYCADCEAKAPRWAAWNLGIFICIRCAGIHRNLGVHISRVKSVNLDQWTIEQLESMQAMGNTNARRIYEARLPEEFRRPQTDYSVESFIRDKYERKKYIDVTFDPSSLKNSKEIEKSRMVEWEEKENLQENPVVFEKVKIKAMERQKEQQENVDLLSLADSQASREQSPQNGDDFGPMLSNPLPVTENMRMPEPLEVEGVEGVRKKPLSKASILSLYGPQGGHGYLRSVHHSMPPLVYPVFSPGPISPHAVATPQPHPLAHSAQLGNLIPAGAFYAGQMPGQGWVCPTLGSSYFMGPATTYSSLATNVGQVSQQLSRLNVSTSQGMMLQGQRPGLFAGSWEMTHNTSTSRGTPSWK